MRDGEMRTWIRGAHVLGGNGPVDAVVMYVCLREARVHWWAGVLISLRGALEERRRSERRMVGASGCCISDESRLGVSRAVAISVLCI